MISTNPFILEKHLRKMSKQLNDVADTLIHYNNEVELYKRYYKNLKQIHNDMFNKEQQESKL